jgi:hypothetical protein
MRIELRDRYIHDHLQADLIDHQAHFICLIMNYVI